MWKASWGWVQKSEIVKKAAYIDFYKLKIGSVFEKKPFISDTSEWINKTIISVQKNCREIIPVRFD